MRHFPFLLAVLASCALCAAVFSHGASYPPPGPAPVGNLPVPAQPLGGGATGAPGTPRAGGAAATPSPSAPAASTPSPGGPQAGPATPGYDPSLDLSAWHFWWHFNKDPFLRLKERLYSAGPASTGSEEFLGFGRSQTAAQDLRPSEVDVRERIRPALVRALEEEASDSIVSSALIALARIGDDPQDVGTGLSPLAQLFRKHLTSPSQEIQETAALALGILANDRNVFLLANVLEEDAAALRALGVDWQGEIPQRTRAFAAYALGLIARSASVPARAEIARIGAERLQAEGRAASRSDLAVACITSLGLAPLPWRDGAQTAPRKTEPGARIDLRSRQDQIAWLLELCDDPQLPNAVAAHLPVAIGRLLSDVADAGELRVRAVARLARDLAPLEPVDALRRQGCALALGLIVDADEDPSDVVARRALAAAVSGLTDRNARRFALLSLAQAATRPGRGEGDPLAGLRGPEGARAFLLQRLAEGRSGLAPWAALGLGVMEFHGREIGQADASEVRSELLHSLDKARAAEEVGALSIALGLCGGAEAASGLREALARSSDPEAQVHVAVALGMAGQSQDLEPLLELARASTYRPALMEAASIGAALLGGRGVGMELAALLEASTGVASQASLCRGLGFIGDRRSIDVLVKLLADRERLDLARSFAAVALGLVADKQDLPWGSAIASQANYCAYVPTFWDPYGASGVLNLF